MKSIKKRRKLTNLAIGYDFQIDLSDRIPPKVLLFDIETTGFSSKSSTIYLIGAAWFEDQTIVSVQFFAETPDEEPALLLKFQKLAREFDTFLSYNGTGFDLPFLTGRAEKLKLDISECICSKQQIDLYKDVLSYKHVFHLENYKQKTVEHFFGIHREDGYTGGELIPVYQEYQKSKEKNLLYRLLQHNGEDILGLASLLAFYSIDAVLKGDFSPVSCSCSNYRKLDGQTGMECQVTCQPAAPLPVTCSCNNDAYYLHISQEKLFFRIPLYEGSLKFFYPNYKDYYYLPEEDMAIHKSVAAYVDKAHRTKAKASNCYQIKAGAFLPQYEEFKTPAFYQNYKDPVSYFEWLEEYISQPWQLKNYCMHILQVLKQGL